ncbi:two-component system, chemotaxis family, sensor kinase CheA [Oceanospirillum multiglobuliferum]|uniref:Chemotaxis protein CheA n=1 Tax=Oceanospirillum multiglobuliferum TaxID=64969 RepID=A0A1T4L5L0_9GAMM|nr:chemotaxis protein CheA [Oceanospirillum multiglobuliferum]OPX56794.1 chemotaxis protein CheA [Oceanospirillum multiglobuliferum]SJZ49873.1 two-component system, chemotaxis family, sensor kinase CheA [Oceanospirillum multiglobuliferum]
MSFDVDQDILQDFLIEAGEILELLSEQLVDLEQSPDDPDLLNAIFRGFHTVKGGAGFLQLTPLVSCCHVAENVFDILRKRQRTVTSELMDSVLSALDSVNEMFEEVRAGQMPSEADPALIRQLEFFATPESADEQAPVEEALVEEAPAEETTVFVEESKPAHKPEPPASAVQDSEGDITDAEFESLLDALQGQDGVAPSTSVTQPAAPSSSSANGNDDITEEEFEALLDQLHGSGSAPTEPAAKAPVTASSSSSGDLITDDEFEALLDQLHGGGSPTAPVEDKPAALTAKAPVAPAAPKPAQKAVAPVAKAPPAPAEEKKVAVKKEAAPAAETTVRVDTSRLDDIMNMVGELVLVRNRLVRLGGQSSDPEISKAVGNLDVVTADLQTSVMKTRMQPIKKVFGRFPRVVRDLSRTLRKEINLRLIGEDTDLDKNLVEALADPLIHLVRNAVDHGIEMPEVREERGKPRVGEVVLSAEQEGNHILLTISDDGAGMNPSTLRRKAVEKNILDQDAADRLTDGEAFNLIFAAGLSTKEQISDVSGRGVGMDVVKTKISQLNGIINVWSEEGKGSKIIIKVPLTLAIMPTLMVILGDQTFALPLVNVNEIFQLDISRANIVDGQEVLVIRNKTLPLFYLKEWLVPGADVSRNLKNAHVVVVSVGTQKVGFVVDQLVGQEEVVIKPLGDMLHGTPGMAGATITGDGRIALILDIPGMLKHYARSAH